MPLAGDVCTVVLTPDEIRQIFSWLEGVHCLLARLVYGTGMRLMEGLRLRVKDIDFDHLTIIVRKGNGGKDRAVMMPQALKEGLKTQLVYSQSLWTLDRSQQRNGVEMPYALEKKYPKAGSSWMWHWLFPQDH